MAETEAEHLQIAKRHLAYARNNTKAALHQVRLRHRLRILTCEDQLVDALRALDLAVVRLSKMTPTPEPDTCLTMNPRSPRP
ncbi:MAG TPA: hypothetical protein VM389_12955 [Phycisphaerae bacterium]|nr:hypothetical protein [Phycisphaerae bacterium]